MMRVADGDVGCPLLLLFSLYAIVLEAT